MHSIEYCMCWNDSLFLFIFFSSSVVVCFFLCSFQWSFIRAIAFPFSIRVALRVFSSHALPLFVNYVLFINPFVHCNYCHWPFFSVIQTETFRRKTVTVVAKVAAPTTTTTTTNKTNQTKPNRKKFTGSPKRFYHRLVACFILILRQYCITFSFQLLVRMFNDFRYYGCLHKRKKKIKRKW